MIPLNPQHHLLLTKWKPIKSTALLMPTKRKPINHLTTSDLRDFLICAPRDKLRLTWLWINYSSAALLITSLMQTNASIYRMKFLIENVHCQFMQRLLPIICDINKTRDFMSKYFNGPLRNKTWWMSHIATILRLCFATIRPAERSFRIFQIIVTLYFKKWSLKICKCSSHCVKKSLSFLPKCKIFLYCNNAV